MKYQQFREIFHTTVFGRSKADLLEKLARYPERYVGIFRPTKPHAKLIQNLTQSNEIRFGDAFEIITEQYLCENGYATLDNRLQHNGEPLVIDQLLIKHSISKDSAQNIVFIEQKIRDDHDSTKKRGQIANFEKKLVAIQERYQDHTIRGYLYFVDPSLSKNKRYYVSEIAELSHKYSVELQVAYGNQLFNDLNLAKVWNEIEQYLITWKQEVPDLPQVNFDADAHRTFEEIKGINTSIYRKLFEHERIIKDIFPIIFPTGEVLKLLGDHFAQHNATVYQHLVQRISLITRAIASL